LMISLTIARIAVETETIEKCARGECDLEYPRAAPWSSRRSIRFWRSCVGG